MPNRRPPRVASVAGFAVAVLLVSGCAERAHTSASGTSAAGAISTGVADASAESPSTAPTSSSPTPVTEEVDVPTFPGDTSTDVADPADPEGLTVTAVRAARHEGYDRVVFEFSGSGTPGWSAEYVDTPSAQGSGAAVDVPGSAFLQITLQGTSYPYETGAEEVTRGPVSTPGTGEVAGAFYDGTFEGTSVAWIGTGARTPFRVYALTGPSRVVVEVADAG